MTAVDRRKYSLVDGLLVMRVNVLGLIRGYLMEIITSFREFFGVDD